MKNEATWRPSKFVRRGGRLRGTHDVHALGIGSRLVADLVAARYDEALPRHARGRLLDLGCGQVPLFETYRAHVDGVTTLDWAAGEHVDIVADLADVLPLPDAAFDTLLSSDVLEHLPEPMLAWREMARVLAPGGTVIANVPFLYPIHAHPHDHFRYTRFALERFVELAGLQLVSLEAVGGLAEVLADMAGKVLARVPLVGPPLAALKQAAAFAWAQSGPGRRIAGSTARNYPLGYFLVASKAGPAP